MQGLFFFLLRRGRGGCELFASFPWERVKQATTSLLPGWSEWLLIELYISLFPPPFPFIPLSSESLSSLHTSICPILFGPTLQTCRYVTWRRDGCHWASIFRVWGQREAFIGGLPIVPIKMVSSRSMWLLHNKFKNVRRHELVNKMNKYTIMTIHTSIVFCCVYQHWFITNDIGRKFFNNKGKIS